MCVYTHMYACVCLKMCMCIRGVCVCMCVYKCECSALWMLSIHTTTELYLQLFEGFEEEKLTIMMHTGKF